MILNQRDNTLVIGAIGVVVVSLVDENHRLRACFRNEVVELILWRDAGRWIVGVADVNESFLRRRGHLWQIMAEARCERNLYNIGAAGFRVMKDCLKGWIRDDQLAVPG